MSQHIEVSIQNRVLVLTLNRPKAKNALNQAMYTKLAEELEAAPSNSEIRAVLFRAEGDAFCAGNDMRDFLSAPLDGPNSPVLRFLRAVSQSPLPLVAAVKGAAIGIGTTLLLHCDLAVAADTSLFKMPFVQLALVPEAASSLLVPLMVGHVKATELLVLGESFGAVDAERYGFVNRVVGLEDVDDAAMSYATRLAGLPPGAVRASKALMKGPSQKEVASVMAAEAEVFKERLGGPEAKEAVTAFLEKRRPDFSRF